MERFAGTLAFPRDSTDGYYLPAVHKRLGELYEAKGDRARAESHYTAFVQLWQQADPELQPQVDVVRRRLKVLARAESG